MRTQVIQDVKLYEDADATEIDFSTSADTPTTIVYDGFDAYSSGRITVTSVQPVNLSLGSVQDVRYWYVELSGAFTLLTNGGMGAQGGSSALCRPFATNLKAVVGGTSSPISLAVIANPGTTIVGRYLIVGYANVSP